MGTRGGRPCRCRLPRRTTTGPSRTTVSRLSADSASPSSVSVSPRPPPRPVRGASDPSLGESLAIPPPVRPSTKISSPIFTRRARWPRVFTLNEKPDRRRSRAAAASTPPPPPRSRAFTSQPSYAEVTRQTPGVPDDATDGLRLRFDDDPVLPAGALVQNQRFTYAATVAADSPASDSPGGDPPADEWDDADDWDDDETPPAAGARSSSGADPPWCPPARRRVFAGFARRSFASTRRLSIFVASSSRRRRRRRREARRWIACARR